MSQTRAECIAAASESIAEAELAIRRGAVEEAARRAYTPTGPPIEELERRIREIREADARRALSDPPAGVLAMALDDLDRATLELEQRWYRHAGAKQAAARELGLASTEYWVRLNRLIDDPAAVVEFPQLTSRLRRLRDERQRQRAPRRAS